MVEPITDWDEFNFERHFLFSEKVAEKINYLTCSLAKHFGLNSFVLYKIYWDNSEIRLTNQIKWTKHYLRNELYKYSIFENNPRLYSKSRMLWANITTHNPILSEAKKFGIEYGITFVEPVTDGCEFYFIGTTTGNAKVIDTYLTNLDLVEKFIATFRVKARGLLQQAYLNRILIPDKFMLTPCFTPLNSVERFNFLTELSGYSFTKREIDCISLLLRGKTAKMIALDLGLSYRTIEGYIENLRVKTQTSSKAELTDKISKIYL